MSIKKKLYHSIGMKTPEEEIRERVRIIQQLIQEEKSVKEGSDYSIEDIKDEFYLEGLAVANKNGKLIKQNGENFEDILGKEGIYKYLIKELPDTKVLTLRNNGRNQVIYNSNDKIYLMKTPGSVSMPEIKRIAEKLGDVPNARE